MDVLTSICVHAVKMCVCKEWNLWYNSLQESCGCECGLGQAPTLFDVGSGFEVYLRMGQEVFLGSSYTSDNPF